MKFGFVGDLGLIGAFARPNNFQMSDDLRLTFDECDHVVGNLETVLCPPGLPTLPSSVHVRSDIQSVEILNQLGIGAVNLANNHIFDFGGAGLASTISILEENEIEWFGVHGKALTLPEARVRMHGYCSYSTNGNNYGAEGLHPLTLKSIQSAYEKDRRDGYYSIFNLHWGMEHAHFPTREQRNFVKRLATMDALIIGHHSHTIQPSTNYENLRVCYSLGNFCFDDIQALKTRNFVVRMTPRNREGIAIIADIDFQEEEVPQLQNFSFVGTQIAGSSIGLSQRVLAKFEELNRLFTELTEAEIEQLRQADFKNQVAHKFGTRRDWSWFVNRLNGNAIRFKLLVFRNKLIHKFLRI